MARIFITGASSGFGKGTATELAKRGHTVFATMRGVEGKNAEVAREFRDLASSEGLALHVLNLDVTDDASVEQAVTQAVTEAGGLDVLVNNAGIGVMGIQETVTPEQARQLFDVNVLGVLRVNRAVLPHMREQGRGLIIYLSSAVGRLVMPFSGLYAASKFALEALAEAASYELNPLGIDSLIIQPGAYGTDFGSNVMMGADSKRVETYGPVKDMQNSFLTSMSQGQPGDPQEVVSLIAKAVEEGVLALRQPIGGDMKQPTETINETSRMVQQQLQSSFGLA